MSLPAADDLFRTTDAAQKSAEKSAQNSGQVRRVVRAVADEATPADAGTTTSRRPSGRVRHDEKMTVYVTSAELHDIEQARLTLRAEHGLALDRGRLVREALVLVLADFDARGADSALVHRLEQS